MTLKSITVLLLAVTWCQIAFGAQIEPNTTKICSTCRCDPKSNSVICSNINLFHVFTADEWIALNKTQPTIESVHYDNNGISIVTPFPVMSIRYLSFKHNMIAHIEKRAFKNLTNLEHLDLSYNRLTSEVLTPEVFEGKYSPEIYEPLKSLKILNLAQNDLHSLNQDLFEHFPNLEELSLSNNPFKVIDHVTTVALGSVPSLKILDLSYMELTTIPDHILHTPQKLTTLKLNGNLFKSIPSALQFAINLIELDMDENIIEEFSRLNVFPALPKLQTLSISYMETLKSIGNGAFSNLPGLQTLKCSNNPHLSYLDAHAFSRAGKESKERKEWPPIRQLYMHNNNLSIIAHELVGRWDEVELIDIRLNPWICDCENQWMVEVLIPIIRNNTPALLKQIVCDQPSQMLGIELHEVNEKHHHMRCLDYFGNHPERDGAILIAMLVGILIGIPLALGIVLIYKRGCFGILGYGPGPADYSRAFYKRAGLQEDLTI